MAKPLVTCIVTDLLYHKVGWECRPSGSILEIRLHTTEVAVKSTSTHYMLRRLPTCCVCVCVCEVHTVYYFAAY